MNYDIEESLQHQSSFIISADPTITLGPEDSGNGTPTILDMIPIQVIKNVDLVKGKRTLVRVSLNFNNGTENATRTASITNLHLNGTRQNFTNSSNPINLTSGSGNFIDVFFTNTAIEGQNLNLSVIIASTVPGFNTTSIMKPVNVTKTRQFNVTFVPIHTIGSHFGDPQNFQRTVNETANFLNKTYPVSDGGLKINKRPTLFDNVPLYFDFTLWMLLKQVERAGKVTGEYPERTVGVVKEGFFSEVIFAPPGKKGFSNWEGSRGIPAVLTEDTSIIPTTMVPAHEIGHTYELCDEHEETPWLRNHLDGTQCPNGNKSGFLNPICLEFGCPTFSLQPLTGQLDEQLLDNFMGGVSGQPWVTNETFSHLLQNFTHSSPPFHEKRILISGTYNKTDKTASFDPFYTLGPGFAQNPNETSGNFTIELKDVNNKSLFNLSFGLSFTIYYDSGNFSEINETAFVFVLPFNENTSILFLTENQSVKDTVNVTPNKPNITVLSPNGGEHFSNEQINITWNSSDLDGDNISFAVLMSTDGGVSFQTLVIDYTNTSLVINSSSIPDSKKTLIRVLATDSVNTANDTGNNVFEIDNNLNITSFSAVYSNETQRVFKIVANNTLTKNISNISWTLDTGNGIKSSLFEFMERPRILRVC